MESIAKTISALEARRRDLASELAQIDERLAAVATVLKDKNAETMQSNPHNSTQASGGKGGASKRTRRSWFARDEAAKLLRRVAKTARPAADLVREVTALKGYADKLSVDDLRRFQGAAFMAINHAVKAGALKRRKDGGYQAA